MAPEATSPQLVLSGLMLSPTDLTRVKHELAALHDYLQAQRLRQPGMPMEQLPKLSRTLDDLMQINHLNLLHESERQALQQFVDQLEHQAPVLHISFAADPSSASLQKLVLWLRQNLHPLALVSVGLQPTIVAGCVVRTTNRYFDFSLKHFLADHRDYLVEALTPKPQPAPEPSHE